MARSIADFGRGQVRGFGWYSLRGQYQQLTLGVLVAIWFVLVVVVIWRIPPSLRARYAPATIAILTVIAFALSRLVSFHRFDVLLDRRDIGGMRLGDVMEVVLLVMLVITTYRSTTNRHGIRRRAG